MVKFVASPSAPSSISLLLRLWVKLETKRKIQFCILLFLSLVNGFAELISLVALVPFLKVISFGKSNLDGWYGPALMEYAERLGEQNFIIVCTIIFSSIILLCTLLRIINLWANKFVAARIGSDLSYEAFKRTLYQPYSLHISRNSNEIVAITSLQVSRLVVVLNSVLQVFSSSLIALSIFLALSWTNFQITVTTTFIFGASYLAIIFLTKNRLTKNSSIISSSTANQIKVTQEALSGIREVILDGSFDIYINEYDQLDKKQRKLSAINKFWAASPRYLLEGIGIVCIAALAACISVISNTSENTLAILGVIALGSQKLLPAIQQVYSGWAIIKGGNSSIYDVLMLLDQPYPTLQSLSFDKSYSFKGIKFEDVSFAYADTLPLALDGVDLTIRKGEVIGIIGKSGSGKTTFIDIFMGLLNPTRGNIYIFDEKTGDWHLRKDEEIESWKKIISHVPQDVYLADTSIARNIAFGIKSEDICFDRIIESAKKAQIHDYILSLDKGYSTIIGERGVKLSGGQKQRLGIARAFYKKSLIMVLDEATSALDNETEKFVIDSISSVSKDLTVIFIAHRYASLKTCDRIHTN